MTKLKSPKQYKKRTGVRNYSAGTSNIAAVWDIVRSERFHFEVALALSCIGLYAAIQMLPPSFTKPVNEHTAGTLGQVLNALGIAVSTANSIVSNGSISFEIIPECTALFMVGFFLCFIAFYPATVRQKAVGLSIGIPTLYTGNMIRLAATFVVTRYDRKLFEVVHVYLGQVFTMLLVIITCFLWLKWLDKKESQQRIPMKEAIFLARFAAISGCLFLVWMNVHHGYIWLLDRFMILGFSLFDYHIELAQNTNVYYETFSIVTFTSLVLATGSISWAMKIKRLSAGLGFLFLTHLFHRIDNALIAYFNFTAAQTADMTLLVIGQYLLPVLFLIFLIRRQKQERLQETKKAG